MFDPNDGGFVSPILKPRTVRGSCTAGATQKAVAAAGRITVSPGSKGKARKDGPAVAAKSGPSLDEAPRYRGVDLESLRQAALEGVCVSEASRRLALTPTQLRCRLRDPKLAPIWAMGKRLRNPPELEPDEVALPVSTELADRFALMAGYRDVTRNELMLSVLKAAAGGLLLGTPEVFAFRGA